jgi:hypothetical protein
MGSCQSRFEEYPVGFGFDKLMGSGIPTGPRKLDDELSSMGIKSSVDQTYQGKIKEEI